MGETINPTAREAKAITELKALAKRWPKSLWLFSASGTLCVMRAAPDGDHYRTPDGGVDPLSLVNGFTQSFERASP